MLVALKRLIDRPCHVIEVHLSDVKVVVCKNLSVSNELALIDVATIEVKGELLSETLLDRCHLGLVAKGEVIDGVSEVEWVPAHVEHLHNLSEGMGRQMEVSWHLVDDDSSLDQATLLTLQSLDCFRISLLRTLACVCEIGAFIHLNMSTSEPYQVMEAQVVSIAIEPVLVELASYVHDVNSSDIHDVQAQYVARCPVHRNVQVDVQLSLMPSMMSLPC